MRNAILAACSSSRCRSWRRKPSTLRVTRPAVKSVLGASLGITLTDPYAEAMVRIHRRMGSAIGTNASETWIRLMIEHHRGAIKMSRIALTKATDPQVRAMSRRVIDDQQLEVAEMQAWLKRHGKKAQQLGNVRA